MQIKQILRNATEKLKNIVENPSSEAEILLAHTLDKSREYLIAHGEDEVGDCSEFFGLIERRISGEPLAYILGYQEFFGHKFIVNPGVLIPRPETEIMVEEALKYIQPQDKIIDVGTGSGAIGISVKLAKPDAKITLLDIDPNVFDIAQKNADILGARVGTICSNNFFNQERKKFDIILANLPYIPDSEFLTIQQSVFDHEPHLALFGGEDGLDLYRQLFTKISKSSHKPRVVICEIAYNQGELFAKLAQEFFPNYSLEIKKDYAGFDRTPILVLNSSV